MIENKETAYCMAKLEDAIRAEDKSAAIYLDCNDGKQDDYGAARMRAIAREGVYNTEKEYAFSAGIVEGGRARVY